MYSCSEWLTVVLLSLLCTQWPMSAPSVTINYTLNTSDWQTRCVVLFSYLQRPMGLLALLDEESKFPRASDLSLAGKDEVV